MSYQDQESRGINLGPGLYSLDDESREQDLLMQIRTHPAYDKSIEPLIESILHSGRYDYPIEELSLVLRDLRRKEEAEALNEEMMRSAREAHNQDIMGLVVGAEEPQKNP